VKGEEPHNDKWKRIIVHVDMDAFYASIEQLDNPAYRGKPVIVGADPKGGKGRGVVSAASYEARRYGIHSAMPISRAYRLCPHGVYIRPRFNRYAEVSEKIFMIFNRYSPVIEKVSIDEAFLDCTGTERLFGKPDELVTMLKKDIKIETGLTASVGVATSKSVAKIASEINKPDGVMIVPPGKEKEFLAPLPLGMLWGIGSKTMELFKEMGFKTIGDLASARKEDIEGVLGKNGAYLWELANGIDNFPVVADRVRKSIGAENTFPIDVSDDLEIEETLLFLSEKVTRRMRDEGVYGRTVTLKIRLEDFSTFTRRKTLKDYFNDMKTLKEVSLDLYRAFTRGKKKVRLVGISVSGLRSSSNSPEKTLFENDDTGKKLRSMELDAILDRLREKYGDAVKRAVFLKDKNLDE